MRQDNKMRMVEIGNYENDRYESHKNIFRNIAFSCLAILIGVFVSKRGFTRIGRTITPAVKTHIGATTISTDSKDMN